VLLQSVNGVRIPGMPHAVIKPWDSDSARGIVIGVFLAMTEAQT